MIQKEFSPQNEYKVLVRCFTYNQSMYIVDALNGFAMQKTDFPYVCLVVDDCSNDGEPETIKAWMNQECDVDKVENIEIEDAMIIILPHKSNPYCTFAFYFLKRNLYKFEHLKMSLVAPWREKCEYEAICEGDDYWIDDEKLQLQVNFLESHPLHSMVFHAYKRVESDGTETDSHRYEGDKDNCPITDVIKYGGAFCATASNCYRLKTYGKGYYEWVSSCVVGDCPMQLTLGVKGNIGYIDRVMSVYRHDAQSSWTANFKGNRLQKKVHYKSITNMWLAFNKWTKNQYLPLIIGIVVKKFFEYKKYQLHCLLTDLFGKK